MNFEISSGVGGSRLGFCGSEHAFDESSSSSSGSSCSPDSSDLEEEDDRGYVEDASDRDAAADFTSGDDIDHTPLRSDEQYDAACDNIAEEMRNEAAAQAPKLFVSTPKGWNFDECRQARSAQLRQHCERPCRRRQRRFF